MRKVLWFFTLFALCSCQEEKAQIQENTNTIENIPLALSKKEDTLNIIAVGDIMIGSAFPSEEFLPPNDGKNSFDAVKDYLKGDIVFGNLEGVFLDEGDSEKCKNKEPNRCYAFRMPERYGTIIREAGFNVMSIANNHTGDFGSVGRKKTTEILENLGIHYAGHKEKPFKIFEKNGVKYGFCAFAPNKNMISLNNHTEAQRIVRTLKKQADIVIISFHGGAEGSEHTHIPKREEFFYGENRGDVHLFAHKVIDAGADLVLGHGPHITRAVEVYKGKFIAYSLGNFNTYGRFNLKNENGIAPILNIKLDQNGDFLKAKVISTQQTYDDGLLLDHEQKAFQELKKLTDTDFPDHNLIFENGEITLRK